MATKKPTPRGKARVKVKKAPEASRKKPPKNERHPPFKGDEGVQFSKDNQPSPEKKKEGWAKLREKRLLTQKILEVMLEGDTLDIYVKKLIIAASKGNPKAIETINKGLEDDIIKIDHKVSNGSTIIDWTGKYASNNTDDKAEGGG